MQKPSEKATEQDITNEEGKPLDEKQGNAEERPLTA